MGADTNRGQPRGKERRVNRVHPATALLTLVAIGLTAEWAINREESLVAQFIAALGG